MPFGRIKEFRLRVAIWLARRFYAFFVRILSFAITTTFTVVGWSTSLIKIAIPAFISKPFSQVLERLVKSAKILKIDASKYESELATMQKGNKSDEKPIPPAVEQPTFSKEKEIPREKTKTTLPASFKGKNVLHSVAANEKNITLEFGSNVSKNGIKVFGLNSSESYKRVIWHTGYYFEQSIHEITPLVNCTICVSVNTATIPWGSYGVVTFQHQFRRRRCPLATMTFESITMIGFSSFEIPLMSWQSVNR